MKHTAHLRHALLAALVLPWLTACGLSGGSDSSSGEATGSSTGSGGSLAASSSGGDFISSSSSSSGSSSGGDTAGASSSSSSGAGASMCVVPPTPSSSSSSSSGGASTSCAGALNTLFCEDFNAGNTNRWTLSPATGGSFDVIEDADVGSKALEYTINTTVANAGGVVATLNDAAWTVPTGNYYVQARIKPMTAARGNKFIYLIGRYQDSRNWYAGGLNVQSTSASTKVEIANMINGVLNRPVQSTKPIEMGQWYTVRFEMDGNVLTVYLDGARVGSQTITGTAFTSGKIGLYTDHKSFEIDDIQVGNAADRPAQLSLSPALTAWTDEAGNPAKDITVTAIKADNSADTFTVTSNNPAVVSVSTQGNVVSLTPVSEGNATITFTSGSNASLTRTINAVIAPAFVQSTAVYSLAGKASPAPGETAAPIDTPLKLTFDAMPELCSTGSIRIFRKSDDALVDTLKLSGEKDVIGYTGQNPVRVVNFNPITISGNVVTITPHNNKLSYNTEYYVAIADGAFGGAKLAGQSFRGMGKVAGWSFKTKAAPPTGSTVTVGANSDFLTVQGALNYVMQNIAQNDPATVNIKNGTYTELLYLRNKNNLTIKGESREGVVLQYDNYETLNTGSGASSAANVDVAPGGRSVFMIEGSDMLTLDTLTLKSTHVKVTTVSNQAETIYYNSDTGRLIAKNANFIGAQDTIQVKGYSWFYNTRIDGDVDFIWGNNRVALFENSIIRTVVDTTDATKGGYLVQARTVTAADKGFVFLNSTLTKADPALVDGNTVLARSGGSSTYFDNVSFINCKMDTHIATVGWLDTPMPNPTQGSAASGWREYGSKDMNGQPLNVSGRGATGYQLSTAEYNAGFATRAAIFSAYNSGAGWNPQP